MKIYTYIKNLLLREFNPFVHYSYHSYDIWIISEYYNEYDDVERNCWNMDTNEFRLTIHT